MLNIILIILSGVVVGYFIRKVPQVVHVGTAISLIIMLLLFFLGISVGANEQVVKNFATIGFDALIITLGGITGTILCAWWVYAKFFKKNKE
ncbi:MAG: LysO family transporter [Bacteroidia bacterium]|nr:LysO family transporter [Bacteroidia bacterium]